MASSSSEMNGLPGSVFPAELPSVLRSWVSAFSPLMIWRSELSSSAGLNGISRFR